MNGFLVEPAAYVVPGWWLALIRKSRGEEIPPLWIRKWQKSRQIWGL